MWGGLFLSVLLLLCRGATLLSLSNTFPATSLPSRSQTLTVTISNSGDRGFYPFIDFAVPTGFSIGSPASTSGVPLTTTVLTFTSTYSCKDHPVARNSSDLPVQICGSNMVVVVCEISLNYLGLDITSQSLQVAITVPSTYGTYSVYTRAGYTRGADRFVNPTTDPSILSHSSSAPANWAPETVTITTMTWTVGVGNTLNGPSFGANLAFSARFDSSSNSLTNVTLNATIPDGVVVRTMPNFAGVFGPNVTILQEPIIGETSAYNNFSIFVPLISSQFDLTVSVYGVEFLSTGARNVPLGLLSNQYRTFTTVLDWLNGTLYQNPSILLLNSVRSLSHSGGRLPVSSGSWNWFLQTSDFEEFPLSILNIPIGIGQVWNTAGLATLSVRSQSYSIAGYYTQNDTLTSIDFDAILTNYSLDRNGTFWCSLAVPALILDEYTTDLLAPIYDNDGLSATSTLYNTTEVPVNVAVTTSGSFRILASSWTFTLVARNGAYCSPCPTHVHPSDILTLATTGTLPSTDVAPGLTLSYQLPLAVDGTDLGTWGPLNLTSGNAWGSGHTATLFPPPTWTNDASSLSFSFVTVNDTTNTQTQLQLLWTLPVLTKPFSDGRSFPFVGYFVDSGVRSTKIVQMYLDQPVLSLSMGAVAASAGSGAVFSPACPSYCSYWTVFVAGPPQSSITSSTLSSYPLGSSITSIDAGATIKIVIAIVNSGGSEAYDIPISLPTIPTGMVIPPTGENLFVSLGNRAALSYSGTSIFSGITIPMLGASSATGSNIALISFELMIDPLTYWDSSFRINTTLCNYAGASGAENHIPYLTGGNCFSVIADVAVTQVAMTGSLTSTSDRGTTFSSGFERLTAGESATFLVTTSLPVGSGNLTILLNTTSTFDISSVDVLTIGTLSSPLVNLSGFPTCSPSTLSSCTLTFGEVVSSSPTAVVVQLTAINRLNNSASQSLILTASVPALGLTMTPITVKTTIPVVSVSHSSTPTTGDAGDNVTVTVTVTETSALSAAYSILLNTTSTNGLVFIPGSLTWTNPAVNNSLLYTVLEGSDSSDTKYRINITSLAAGATVAFKYVMTVPTLARPSTAFTVTTTTNWLTLADQGRLQPNSGLATVTNTAITTNAPTANGAVISTDWYATSSSDLVVGESMLLKWTARLTEGLTDLGIVITLPTGISITDASVWYGPDLSWDTVTNGTTLSVTGPWPLGNITNRVENTALTTEDEVTFYTTVLALDVASNVHNTNRQITFKACYLYSSSPSTCVTNSKTAKIVEPTVSVSTSNNRTNVMGSDLVGFNGSFAVTTTSPSAVTEVSVWQTYTPALSFSSLWASQGTVNGNNVTVPIASSSWSFNFASLVRDNVTITDTLTATTNFAYYSCNLTGARRYSTTSARSVVVQASSGSMSWGTSNVVTTGSFVALEEIITATVTINVIEGVTSAFSITSNSSVGLNFTGVAYGGLLSTGPSAKTFTVGPIINLPDGDRTNDFVTIAISYRVISNATLNPASTVLSMFVNYGLGSGSTSWSVVYPSLGFALSAPTVEVDAWDEVVLSAVISPSATTSVMWNAVYSLDLFAIYDQLQLSPNSVVVSSSDSSLQNPQTILTTAGASDSLTVSWPVITGTNTSVTVNVTAFVASSFAVLSGISITGTVSYSVDSLGLFPSSRTSTVSLSSKVPPVPLTISSFGHSVGSDSSTTLTVGETFSLRASYTLLQGVSTPLALDFSGSSIYGITTSGVSAATTSSTLSSLVVTATNPSSTAGSSNDLLVTGSANVPSSAHRGDSLTYCFNGKLASTATQTECLSFTVVEPDLVATLMCGRILFDNFVGNEVDCVLNISHSSLSDSPGFRLSVSWNVPTAFELVSVTSVSSFSSSGNLLSGTIASIPLGSTVLATARLRYLEEFNETAYSTLVFPCVTYYSSSSTSVNPVLTWKQYSVCAVDRTNVPGTDVPWMNLTLEGSSLSETHGSVLSPGERAMYRVVLRLPLGTRAYSLSFLTGQASNLEIESLSSGVTLASPWPTFTGLPGLLNFTVTDLSANTVVLRYTMIVPSSYSGSYTLYASLSSDLAWARAYFSVIVDEVYPLVSKDKTIVDGGDLILVTGTIPVTVAPAYGITWQHPISSFCTVDSSSLAVVGPSSFSTSLNSTFFEVYFPTIDANLTVTLSYHLRVRSSILTGSNFSEYVSVSWASAPELEALFGSWSSSFSLSTISFISSSFSLNPTLAAIGEPIVLSGGVVLAEGQSTVNIGFSWNKPMDLIDFSIAPGSAISSGAVTYRNSEYDLATDPLVCQNAWDNQISSAETLYFRPTLRLQDVESSFGGVIVDLLYNTSFGTQFNEHIQIIEPTLLFTVTCYAVLWTLPTNATTNCTFAVSHSLSSEADAYDLAFAWLSNPAYELLSLTGADWNITGFTASRSSQRLTDTPALLFGEIRTLTGGFYLDPLASGNWTSYPVAGRLYTSFVSDVSGIPWVTVPGLRVTMWNNTYLNDRQLRLGDYVTFETVIGMIENQTMPLQIEVDIPLDFDLVSTEVAFVGSSLNVSSPSLTRSSRSAILRFSPIPNIGNNLVGDDDQLRVFFTFYLQPHPPYDFPGTRSFYWSVNRGQSQNRQTFLIVVPTVTLSVTSTPALLDAGDELIVEFSVSVTGAPVYNLNLTTWMNGFLETFGVPIPFLLPLASTLTSDAYTDRILYVDEVPAGSSFTVQHTLRLLENSQLGRTETVLHSGVHSSTPWNSRTWSWSSQTSYSLPNWVPTLTATSNTTLSQTSGSSISIGEEFSAWITLQLPEGSSSGQFELLLTSAEQLTSNLTSPGTLVWSGFDLLNFSLILPGTNDPTLDHLDWQVQGRVLDYPRATPVELRVRAIGSSVGSWTTINWVIVEPTLIAVLQCNWALFDRIPCKITLSHSDLSDGPAFNVTGNLSIPSAWAYVSEPTIYIPLLDLGEQHSIEFVVLPLSEATVPIISGHYSYNSAPSHSHSYELVVHDTSLEPWLDHYAISAYVSETSPGYNSPIKVNVGDQIVVTLTVFFPAGVHDTELRLNLGSCAVLDSVYQVNSASGLNASGPDSWTRPSLHNASRAIRMTTTEAGSLQFEVVVRGSEVCPFDWNLGAALFSVGNEEASTKLPLEVALPNITMALLLNQGPFDAGDTIEVSIALAGVGASWTELVVPLESAKLQILTSSIYLEPANIFPAFVVSGGSLNISVPSLVLYPGQPFIIHFDCQVMDAIILGETKLLESDLFYRSSSAQNAYSVLSTASASAQYTTLLPLESLSGQLAPTLAHSLLLPSASFAVGEPITVIAVVPVREGVTFGNLSWDFPLNRVAFPQFSAPQTGPVRVANYSVTIASEHSGSLSFGAINTGNNLGVDVIETQLSAIPVSMTEESGSFEFAFAASTSSGGAALSLPYTSVEPQIEANYSCLQIPNEVPFNGTLNCQIVVSVTAKQAFDVEITFRPPTGFVIASGRMSALSPTLFLDIFISGVDLTTAAAAFASLRVPVQFVNYTASYPIAQPTPFPLSTALHAIVLVTESMKPFSTFQGILNTALGSNASTLLVSTSQPNYFTTENLFSNHRSDPRTDLTARIVMRRSSTFDHATAYDQVISWNSLPDKQGRAYQLKVSPTLPNPAVPFIYTYSILLTFCWQGTSASEALAYLGGEQLLVKTVENSLNVTSTNYTLTTAEGRDSSNQRILLVNLTLGSRSISSIYNASGNTLAAAFQGTNLSSCFHSSSLTLAVTLPFVPVPIPAPLPAPVPAPVPAPLSPPTSPSDESASSAGPSWLIGLISGLVVGCCCCCFLIFFILFWCRRRDKAEEEKRKVIIQLDKMGENSSEEEQIESMELESTPLSPKTSVASPRTMRSPRSLRYKEESFA